MNAGWTFTIGIIILIILGWYLATDTGRRKRLLGTVLTLIIVAFCLQSVYPPFNIKNAAGKIVQAGKIHLGLDLQGGTSFLIQLVHGPDRKITADSLSQAVAVIRKRVDTYGVSEPNIAPVGNDRIMVQIPGLDTSRIQDAREQLERVAKLSFNLVNPQSDQLIPQIQAGQAIIPPGYEIKSYTDDVQGKQQKETLLVKIKPDLTGNYVTNAFATFDQGGWGISLQFDSKGADIFGKLTAANVGHRFAIELDGKVESAPVIQAAIYGGRASISGSFTEKEARGLASVLNNPLQTPVKIDETRSASATLGSDAIHSGIYAGIGGLLLVLIFVGIYYRMAGIIAIFGLIINIVILFGVMSMFNFTLTLPGIAGIILTIGIAIDANVLIYERLREELALGKTLKAAVESAYDKAFSVIMDANVTTLITAGVLFWLASGPVKGFAITLTVGIIGSLFSAMIVTRTCFGWALAGGLKRIKLMHLISAKNHFDFLGTRRIWISISLIVLAISVITFAIHGKKNFGIDFTGGDLLTLSPQKPVQIAQVRKALIPNGLASQVEIQKEYEPSTKRTYISVRTPQNTSTKVLNQLAKNLPTIFPKDNPNQKDKSKNVLQKEDHVGAVIGKQFTNTSLIAFALAIVGILIYVALRFEISFAIGAVVAVLHDIIITLGIFSLFGKELSLIMVGAILTIAGYSINDTIVVYDRIREGLHSGRKGTIIEIMNASINETLSRTLLTSGCTLLSVAALFLFGGAVLHDFAFAILIGIVVGTYSSIFIASPIVLWWSGHKGHKLQAEIKRSQALTAGN